MLSPVALKLLEYYPAPNRPGTTRGRQQPPEPERDARRERPAPGARRPERRQQDPALGALQLVRHLQQRDRRDPGSGHHAAARQQEHAGVVHPCAEAEPLQRFPDRLPPHRLRYAESLLGEQHPDRRLGSRHSRVRRRRQVQQPGSAEHQHQQLQRPGGRRLELVSVRHDVPGVERDGLHARRAQPPGGLRPAAHGDWPAGGERSARPIRLHRRHDDGTTRSPISCWDLPRTVITPADQIQGHVGGWRNGFFINDVWQAVARPHAQPRAALRAQHARPDLRRRWRPCSRKTSRPSSRARFRPRASSSTSRTRRTLLHGSARPTGSGRKRCCAPDTGSTTTRTR